MEEQAQYTRCPQCQTAFKVTSKVLSLAKGKVRCGACLAVFQASDYFVQPRNESPKSQQPQLAESESGKPQIDQTQINVASSKFSETSANTEPAIGQTIADKPEPADAESSLSHELSSHDIEPEIDDVPTESFTADDFVSTESHTEESAAVDTEVTDTYIDDPVVQDDDVESSQPEASAEFRESETSEIQTESDFLESERLESDVSESIESVQSDEFGLPENEESGLTSHVDEADILADSPLTDEQTDQLSFEVDDDAVEEPFSESLVVDDSEVSEPGVEKLADDPPISFESVDEPLESESADTEDEQIPDFDFDIDGTQQPDESGYDELGYEPENLDTATSSLDDNLSTEETDPEIGHDNFNNESFDSTGFDQSDEQADEQASDDSLEENDFEQLADNLTAQIQDTDTEPDPLDEFEHRVEEKKTTLRNAVIASVVVIILTVISVKFWNNRQQLAWDDTWGGMTKSICAVLPCDLKPRRDVAKIKLRQRMVTPSDTKENTLQIKLLLTNEAAFDQPYPKIIIKFSNSDGQQVATKQLEVKEYFPEKQGQLMPAGAEVHVGFETQLPHTDALGFEFMFQ